MSFWSMYYISIFIKFLLAIAFTLQVLILQHPTKVLAPLMLEDYHKVMVDRMGDEEQFTLEHVRSCMEKGTL